MPNPEDDTQAKPNGSTVTDAKTESPSEHADSRDEEGAQQQKEHEDKAFGTLVLAGELADYDPEGDDPRPFDIVAVHGLNGHRESTWTAGGSNCLKDKIHEHYPRSRILSFGYDASASRAGISTLQGIREMAKDLLGDLVRLRKPSDPVRTILSLVTEQYDHRRPESLYFPNQNLFRPLIFIAHDLGGIIVKEALCIAGLEELKYETVLKWTRLLIFFGCSHRCTSIQDMEDKVGSLLFAGTRPVGATSMMKELGKAIIETNESFTASNMLSLMRIVNVYSQEDDSALQIFDKHTTTLDIPFEHRIANPKPHKAIGEFTQYDDLYKSIDETLSHYKSPSKSKMESVIGQKTLELNAAPIYPLRSEYSADHRMHWICQHKLYTEWIDGYGPSILHIHGSNGITNASEYVFQCLDARRTTKDTNEVLLYFSFDKYDDRRNTITAMLNTLLAQICSHDKTSQEVFVYQYEQMFFSRSWTELELFNVFRLAITNLSHSGFWCVIDGLDECEDSNKEFLKELCHLAGLIEVRFKFAISSNSNSEIGVALADGLAINLDEHADDSEAAQQELSSEIDLEVLELLQERPAFRSFDRAITEKLSRCGQDKTWRRLILDELMLSKRTSVKTANQQLNALEFLATPEEIFARVLARVPSERRRWASTALSWILFAFHPLTIWELGVALALGCDSTLDQTLDFDELARHDVAADLEEIFGGLFIIKHNEVHFGHSRLRDFLLTPDTEEDVWYDVKELAHRDIGQACLFYLSLPQVQGSMEKIRNPTDDPTDLIASPIIVPRHDLHTYAVKYWVRHIQLTLEALHPIDHVLEFVQNIKAMHAWAEAYWQLSNPITRQDRSFLSAMPIFAGVGLQDLVERWLDLETESPAAAQDRALALAQAARNGHVEIVRMLLKYGGYSEANLQDALIAGVGYCDEDVLSEIVTYTTKNMVNFDWPPTIITRVAQFGLENVLENLLESGAPLQKAYVLTGMTPLHFAARQGHTGAVKVLLKHNADITARAAFGRVPLHTAAGYGQADVAQQLLDAGSNVDLLDDDKYSALHLACDLGGHKAVQVLATAGCDLNSNERGDQPPLSMIMSLKFIKSIRILLENEANIEVEGPENFTAIRYAANSGNVELCKLLLEHGADPNTTRGGDPVLYIAAGAGKFDIVKVLVENGAAIDAVGSQNWTALLHACWKGHTEIVAYLLDHGADIKHLNAHDGSAILIAANAGFLELVQLLIDRGGDLHQAADDASTPIYLSYDNAEVTRVLLNHGADPNRLVSYFTPLYLAAANNYIETVKVFIEFNVDLEIPYSRPDGQANYTPLDVAVINGNAEVVRLLLEAGANVNHTSQRSNFPIQYGISRNREEILRILLEYRPDLEQKDDDGDTALSTVLTETPVNLIKALVNAGADLECRNKEGNTPLCRAVIVNNADVVKYLIKKKAKLNINGSTYGSPLHIACFHSNIPLMEILVEAGSDVNLIEPTVVGTPLQSACRCLSSEDRSEKQEKMIRYLVEEGNADVSIVGGWHGCALNTACRWSTPNMVKFILEKGAKVEVADDMGRVAIHYGAMRGIDHFQPLLSAEADVEVGDNMGRTVMHWAVLGANIDVVERAFSLSRSLLDQPDVDGWTPLLWAARGVGASQTTVGAKAQEEIITFLLEQGADPCVMGKGLDREWSAVKLARYQGADDAVIQLLLTKAKEKMALDGKADMWEEAFHASRKAKKQGSGYCDSCISDLYGIYYHCKDCPDFDFCYKCYISKDLFHPSSHTFSASNEEYETVEEQKESSDDDDTDDDTDSDDNDDNGKDEEVKKSDANRDAKTETKQVNGEGAEVEEDSSDSDDDSDE